MHVPYILHGSYVCFQARNIMKLKWPHTALITMSGSARFVLRLPCGDKVYICLDGCVKAKVIVYGCRAPLLMIALLILVVGVV